MDQIIQSPELRHSLTSSSTSSLSFETWLVENEDIAICTPEDIDVFETIVENAATFGLDPNDFDALIDEIGRDAPALPPELQAVMDGLEHILVEDRYAALVAKSPPFEGIDAAMPMLDLSEHLAAPQPADLEPLEMFIVSYLRQYLLAAADEILGGTLVMNVIGQLFALAQVNDILDPAQEAPGRDFGAVLGTRHLRSFELMGLLEIRGFTPFMPEPLRSVVMLALADLELAE